MKTSLFFRRAKMVQRKILALIRLLELVVKLEPFTSLKASVCCAHCAMLQGEISLRTIFDLKLIIAK